MATIHLSIVPDQELHLLAPAAGDLLITWSGLLGKSEAWKQLPVSMSGITATFLNAAGTLLGMAHAALFDDCIGGTPASPQSLACISPASVGFILSLSIPPNLPRTAPYPITPKAFFFYDPGRLSPLLSRFDVILLIWMRFHYICTLSNYRENHRSEQ